MDFQTFVMTLMVGAVGGWSLEQQLGPRLLRWARERRMEIRSRRGPGPQ
jgi:hypothetical protein